MKFNRQFFKEAFKAGYKKALKETAINLNYKGNNSDAASTIDSASLYDDDQFVSQVKKAPVNPAIITPEDKKAIYKEIRYGLLLALVEYLGDEEDQDLLNRRFSSAYVTQELRKTLRKNKNVKHRYKSKIDLQEVLDMCEEVYNTAVKYAIKNAYRVEIDEAEAKIRKCANELHEKVCKSVAISLSKRLGLDTMERAMNGSYAWKYLQRVAALGPEKAGKPNYPYPEDY